MAHANRQKNGTDRVSPLTLPSTAAEAPVVNPVTVVADPAAEIAALKAQLAASTTALAEAKAATPKPKLGLKVSVKGAVSMYGIRRFPITYYKEEWPKILDKADAIRAFIAEHQDELATKGD